MSNDQKPLNPNEKTGRIFAVVQTCLPAAVTYVSLVKNRSVEQLSQWFSSEPDSGPCVNPWCGTPSETNLSAASLLQGWQQACSELLLRLR